MKTSSRSCQPNKIVFNEQLNLCITGNEDKEIKFFDIWTSEFVNGYVGHTDSVSSLALSSNGYQLLSGGHDGSIRCWDIWKK